MNTFFYTLLILITSSLITAQANWQPGYVVRDGEKVTGEIDDREWAYFIDEVRFRSSERAGVDTYSPSDGVNFGVANRRFISREVGYITNSRDLEKLSRDTTLYRERADAVLRVYFEGDLSLFQYVDQMSKRHFYLQKKGEAPVYLEYELRLRERRDKNIVKSVDIYKFQLTKLLGDCPQLGKRITNSQYSLKSLQGLVRAWYKCQETQPTYEAKVSGGRINISPSLVFFRTSLSEKNMSTRGTKMANAHYGPAFGVEGKYTSPGLQQKFSAKLALHYHSVNSLTSGLERVENSVTTLIERALDRSTLRVTGLVEYRIITGRVPVYLEAGLVLGQLLDSQFTFEQRITTDDGTVISLVQDLDTSEFRTNELGPVLGAGAYLGRFQLGIRASRVTQDKGSDVVIITRLGLLAGYWF